MFWIPRDRKLQYDDKALMSGEIWSHYLYNIVLWAPGNPPGGAFAGTDRVDPDLVLYGVDPARQVQ